MAFLNTLFDALQLKDIAASNDVTWEPFLIQASA
jgi:hypothetical protein